ncbi:MAG: hypothetical protein MI743_12045 [Sneathiellales bacterium]|nr:hypothetical protein [Sneathiellales bacterium]
MFRSSTPAPHFFEMEFSGTLLIAEQEAFLHVLNRLSEEKEPFVVLTRSEGESPLSTENRKRMNLWFKENREFLGHMCLGTVRVQSGFTDDHYEGSNMQKGMPFPLYSRSTIEAGRSLALEILARTPQEENSQ